MTSLPRQNLTGLSILCAPILVLAYSAVRLLDSGDGPGPVWTVSHLLLIGGFVAFGLAIPGLRALVLGGTRPRQVAADAVAVVTAVGVVCAAGQTISDIVVGLVAKDRAGMDILFQQFHEAPGIGLAFGGVGPILFFAGLPVMFVLLAAFRPRRVTVWSPVLVAIGAFLPVFDLGLLPVAGALMVLGLAPLGWRLLSGAYRPSGSS